MPFPRVRLRVRTADEIADYVRHARVETLKSIRMEPHAGLIEPLSSAVYLVAHAEDRERPVALVEAAFLHQVYGGFDDLPYRSVFDPRRCAFEELAGVRTVYVEPEFRAYHALYLKLIVGQSKIFARLGATWAVATTDDRNERLRQLYEKTGGERLGCFSYAESAEPLALFLFSITKLAEHPLAARYVPESALELGHLAS
jgi:hypothetical protein